MFDPELFSWLIFSTCQADNHRQMFKLSDSKMNLEFPSGQPLVSSSEIAQFMGPTWGPPGSSRPQMGPMLAPWTLLSGWSCVAGCGDGSSSSLGCCGQGAKLCKSITMSWATTGQRYCQTSNIRCTLIGNQPVDHSDVVGASPVGAAPTTSSSST